MGSVIQSLAALLTHSLPLPLPLPSIQSTGGLGSMEPVHEAGYAGNVEEVTRLVALDPGCLDARTPRGTRYQGEWYCGYTPLKIAAERGDDVLLQRLLDLGADTRWDPRGYFATPVWVACRHNRVSTLVILLKAGAEFYSRGYVDGPPPIDVAVSKGFFDCVRLLLAHGYDVNLVRRGRLVERFPEGTVLHRRRSAALRWYSCCSKPAGTPPSVT
jgi:hypothetical protein